ncbi:MAG: bifunctional 3,4-dihydroxy-2-butanone-4-phosphate synthase/GTP cyclohydrolase II [Clostridium sp.]|uniref:bifunctional 3,4-dihydroxy-2-butanone-4-phosphate synthase/GTP cyclohydrolase II n=1 Tax=Clostridium sp. TaxID=1506 RepID=UPI003F2F0783
MIYKFNNIEEALEDIKNGKMIIVVDDEGRENEGDLVMAADKVTPSSINFMATYGRGLICMPTTKDKLEKLNINLMVNENSDAFKTAFTVSIDGAKTKTGISAFERAETIKNFSRVNTKEEEFNTPGHVFPLMAREGGVLVRTGHTEASVDMATLSGLSPVGVICEIMNEDGTMARRDDLMKFKDKHGLKIITIKDLVEYRKKNEALIKRVSDATLPTEVGEFKIIGYEDIITKEEHIALVYGDVSGENILTRVHSECLTGDVFSSLKCDCGKQLKISMERIKEEGKGIIVYMRQEGRGIGLLNKIKAYKLQESGLDTVEANLALGFEDDLREFYLTSQIIKDLGCTSVRLISNNPKKFKEIEKYGVVISDRVLIDESINSCNFKYMKTKKERMGHLINVI